MKSTRGALVVALVGAMLTIWSMLMYVTGPLAIPGFSNFMLPAEMFGVPADLKARGLEAYLKGKNTGWDGQFYYYQSNDIFATRDTISHIDNPPYRYQRIGVSLAAKVVSKVLLQNWVSPLTYYLTTFSICVLAVFVFARFLVENGYSPLWALAWIAGAGTQVTILNALPDAVADAFLILALISFLNRQRATYLVCMSLSALSREAYVVFPILISLYYFFLDKIPLLKERFPHAERENAQWVVACLPVLPFLIWQVYVRMHIGSPSSGSAIVLGAPLAAAFEYVKEIFYLTSFSDVRALQVIGVYLHLALLLFCIFICGRLLVSFWKSRSASLAAPIAVGFLLLVAVYACFSDVVMMDWTGYFKADNMLLFLVPFIYVLMRSRIPPSVGVFFLALVLYFWIPFYQRINAAPLVANIPSFSGVAAECKNDITTKVEMQGISVVLRSGLLNRFFGQPVRTMKVKLTNMSDYVLESTGAVGSLNLAYQWVLRGSDDVVMDGTRFFLSQPLKPGDAEIADFAIVFPEKKGSYDLIISPVEEGCVWLYRKSKQNALVLPFDVR